MKDEGTPFSNVPESRRDVPNVTARLTHSRQINPKAETMPERALFVTGTKNIPSINSRVGKRPLQGVKQLVRMAMSRSRGESIIRPDYPGGVAPKAHTDTQRLFAAGMAALERLIQIIGDPRQIARIF